MHDSAALVEVTVRKTNPDEVGVLTIEQVARRMGISHWTLRDHIHDGTFPLKPVWWSKKAKLYRRVDVERLLTGPAKRIA